MCTLLTRQRFSSGKKLPIKAVLFDLDDTIWDMHKTMVTAHESFVAMLREQGKTRLAERLGDRKRNTEDIATIVNTQYQDRCIDYTEIRREIHRIAVEETNADICHFELTERWTRLRTISAHFFPGAADLLRQLRAKGLVVGAVTNGNADVIEHFDLFDFQVSPGSAKAHKPQPEIYRAAAKLTGEADMGSILFVGDNFENDVKGPQDLGMRGCYLIGSRKDVAPAELEFADFVVEDVAQVFSIVQSHNGWA